MDNVAVRVGENLYLDVPRPLEIFFEIHARIAERVERFGGGVAPRGGQLRRRPNQPHPFSPATSDSL